MSITTERVVSFLAIGAYIAIGSVILNSYFGSGDQACAGHGCPGCCPHEVCVSYCWADSTYIDQDSCTKVRHTEFAPIECEPGGGCFTQSCN